MSSILVNNLEFSKDLAQQAMQELKGGFVPYLVGTISKKRRRDNPIQNRPSDLVPTVRRKRRREVPNQNRLSIIR